MKVRTLLTVYPYRDAGAIGRYMINLKLATCTHITPEALHGDWVPLTEHADVMAAYMHGVRELKASLDAVGIGSRVLVEFER